jgi:hypothetical protein
VPIPSWDSIHSSRQQQINDLYQQQQQLDGWLNCGYTYGYASPTPLEFSSPSNPTSWRTYQIPHVPPVMEQQNQVVNNDEQVESNKQVDEEVQKPSYLEDSVSGVQLYYYTARVSDELQISYGLLPPRDITPWGLHFWAEAKAYDMHVRADRLAEEHFDSLAEKGIYLSEKEENAIFNQKQVEVREQVRGADQKRLEAWQSGHDQPEINLFGEPVSPLQSIESVSQSRGELLNDSLQEVIKNTDSEQLKTARTSVQEKLAATREQHGKTEPAQSRDKERAIER